MARYHLIWLVNLWPQSLVRHRRHMFISLTADILIICRMISGFCQWPTELSEKQFPVWQTFVNSIQLSLPQTWTLNSHCQLWLVSTKSPFLRERSELRQVLLSWVCLKLRLAICSVRDVVILMISSTNSDLTFALNSHSKLSRKFLVRPSLNWRSMFKFHLLVHYVEHETWNSCFKTRPDDKGWSDRRGVHTY